MGLLLMLFSPGRKGGSRRPAFRGARRMYRPERLPRPPAGGRRRVYGPGDGGCGMGRRGHVAKMQQRQAAMAAQALLPAQR